MLKNQRKFYNFLKNFKEILLIFWKFLKILSKFSRKCREKFRKFWKYGFVGSSGVGAPPPEATENMKILVGKSMENGKILKLYMKF